MAQGNPESECHLSWSAAYCVDHFIVHVGTLSFVKVLDVFPRQDCPGLLTFKLWFSRWPHPPFSFRLFGGPSRKSQNTEKLGPIVIHKQFAAFARNIGCGTWMITCSDKAPQDSDMPCKPPCSGLDQFPARHTGRRHLSPTCSRVQTSRRPHTVVPSVSFWLPFCFVLPFLCTLPSGKSKNILFLQGSTCHRACILSGTQTDSPNTTVGGHRQPRATGASMLGGLKNSHHKVMSLTSPMPT